MEPGQRVNDFGRVGSGHVSMCHSDPVIDPVLEFQHARLL